MELIYSPYIALDAWRRASGLMSDALGTGPREAPWREAWAGPGARLRDYGGAEGGPPFLVLPAPFKRPYIWDLAPGASAVRAALERGFRVFLLEWGDDAPEFAPDLADFALRLPGVAVAEIVARTGSGRIVIAGHSLGGTLAAIFAILRPEAVAGLALVDAPLAFGKRDGGPLAEAVAAAPDAARIAGVFGAVVPGSAINAFSARAAPDAFIIQPRRDAIACAGDAERLALHLRVQRWTLDEWPMPARLFVRVAEDLYRSDRLRAGTLDIGGETVRLADLRAPVAAVVNPAGLIVPPRSLLRGLRVAHKAERLVLRYRPEPGPSIQHLGPLVTPGALARLWPPLLDWLGERAGG